MNSNDEEEEIPDFQDTPEMANLEGNRERPPKIPVFSSSPKYMWIPIVVCIVLSGLLASIFNVFNISYEIVPSEYGPVANLIDALIFIGIGAASAFLLIKLIRRKGINVLEKVMMLAFLVLGTFIIYLYGEYLLYLVDQIYPLDNIISYFWLAGSFGISALLVYLYASPKFGDRAHNYVVLIFGVLIGSYLPIIIGTWTSIFILIGFSLYDIYSVKRGPIKEMMDQMAPEGDEEDLESLDWSDITLDIGIGDLAFYSMLTSISLISKEWGGVLLGELTGNWFGYIFPFIMTTAGVLIGAFITFEFVKKAKILPGLPMSIFIGIGMLSLSILIGWLVF